MPVEPHASDDLRMTTPIPSSGASVSVATIPAGTGAPHDRVCATCGKDVELVDANQSVKVWSHVRAPRSPHQIAVVMGKSQWDKWAR